MVTDAGLNVSSLKRRYGQGKTSQAENARYFGVTKQAIAYWFRKLGLKSRRELNQQANG